MRSLPASQHSHWQPCDSSASTGSCRHRLLQLPVLAALLLASVATPVWAQRNLKDIPSPDAELERKTFVVPDGFEVNLYASDPLIAKPIQMNFDADGRLWIASSEVYPQIKPGQKATDKIIVLDDKNRDGVADDTQVFADGLLIPTGVLPDDQGGAYVCNSTELIHLQDTDGDGKADRKRVALSGFGAEDTHHLLHTLRWGHDGAIYMNQSIYIHSHVETPSGVKHLNGGGIWRYKPEAFELDIVCRGFVNPWGHHFDRWGRNFATDGAYGEGINYVFPGAVYVTAVGAKRRLQGLNPGSPKHCGLEILSGRHLPEDWRGSMITNDFRAHRVCRFVVTEDGSGFASRQEVEVIKSNHAAFRPIDVKMGPDGAIYIADWYNPIIQHGEVDFRDPRRDHTHGRIWRVSAKKRPPTPRPNLRESSVSQLLEQLAAPEEWVRLHAKILLRAKGPQVAKQVDQWVAAIEGQDEQANHLRLEALWLYEGLDERRPEYLRKLLASEDHRVRTAALRVASYWRDSLGDALAVFSRAANDDHPRVRLEAVRALSLLESPRAASAALSVLSQPMDRFLDFALWQCMRDLQNQWLPLAKKGEFDFGGDMNRLTFALKSVDSPDVATPLVRLLENPELAAERRGEVLTLLGGLASGQDLGRAAKWLINSSATDEVKAQWLDQFVIATKAKNTRPTADLSGLGKWLERDNAALRNATLRAAGAWKIGALRKNVSSSIQSTDQATRWAAMEALGAYADAEAGKQLSQLAQNSPWPDRRAAIAALSRFQPRRAAQFAAQSLGQAPGGDQLTELLRPIVQRKGGAQALAKALETVKLKSDQAKLAMRSVRGLGSPLPALIEALKKSGDLESAGWILSSEFVRSLSQEVAEQSDAHRGQAIFRRAELQCLKCHAIGGAGGRVGPDMLSLGTSAQVDYLIESLIAPNAKVKENYHSIIVQTDGGTVLTGVPVRQTDQELVIRDAEDKEVTIPINSIEARKEAPSLMPKGSVDALTRDELRDLVRFLSQLGKVDEFSVSKEPLVRTWQLLTPTPQALHRIRRTSFDTAASNDPAFQWQSVYSQVNGRLPIGELAHFNAPTYVTRKDSVKTVFLRAAFEVTQPGKVALDFGAVDGLQLWIDGKPRPAQTKHSVDWKPGMHYITLAVDKLKRSTSPIQIRIDQAQTKAQVKIINGK